jgi:hypothetical protein
MLKLILSLLLGGPVMALWPGRLPAWARKTGTCLALAPVVVACVFLAAAFVTRPAQFWVAGPILVALGTAAIAGGCAFWPSTRPRRARAVAAVLFVGLLLGLFLLGGAIWIGRGGTVYGRVTCRGQPVTAGKVSILSEDGVVCSGDIRADGRYIVYRVPSGPAKFAVAVYSAAAPGPVPIPAPKSLPVPRRYRDFETSGLTGVVERGGQTHHLILMR